jgi:hypothetical protein
MRDNYLKKILMKKLSVEKIWLSAIKHQLETGEIAMNEELRELMDDCEKQIIYMQKQLDNN